MILTFPHMGNLYIAAKILLDDLQLDYVIPPLTNERTLEIGSKISPEEVCLPFKIMMGNYIQSIEKGADTIVLVSSCGPCRFGEYSELQIRLLRKAGYSVQFIVADLPNQLESNADILDIKALYKSIPVSNGHLMGSIVKAVHAINILDDLEATAQLYAGYEEVPGESKGLLKEAIVETYNEKNPTRALGILKECQRKMHNVKVDTIKNNPLKISIIGDIYTIIDSFSSLCIEEKLMDYGVSSSRRLSVSWWIKELLLKPLKLNGLQTKAFSKEYLPYSVGGYARESIADVVMAHNQHYDGAIQVFPSGCMPEIVTKSILPSISKDKDFPIMTLIIDELSNDSGYVTRIEAFLDLLERRKCSCTI